MNTSLERLFGFTPQELEANQNGQLSQKQESRLDAQIKREGFWRRIAFFAIIIPLVGITGMVLYQMKSNLANGIDLYVILAFPIIGFSIFLFFNWLGKVRSDLKVKKISVVQGHVQKSTKYFPKTRMTGYYMEIEGIQFQLDTEKKYQAIQDNEAFQVFFIKHPPTQIILSLAILAHN